VVKAGHLLDSVTSSSSIVSVKKATLSGGAVRIVGVEAVGRTLTAAVDSLVSIPRGVPCGDTLYRWYRDGVTIGGAAGKSYTLTQLDTSAYISVLVTSSNLLGGVTSGAVGPVQKASLSGGAARIVGVDTVGYTLTAVVDSLVSTPTGITYGDTLYQWYRSDALIIGATGKSYLLGQADTSARISVAVKVANLLGSVSASRVSAVEKARLSGGAARIVGVDTVGHTLTAVVDSLTLTPRGVASGDTLYQWYRSGAPVIGATGNSYLLGQADTSARISVLVRAANLLGSVSAGRSSAVEKARLSGGAVRVVGVDTVGHTLTAVVDSLTLTPRGVAPGDTLYQWYRSGAPVIGAAGNSYRRSQEDAGSTVSVTVRASNLLGSVASYPPGSAVMKATLSGGSVRVAGVSAVGHTLTAVVASLASTPHGVASGDTLYRWRRNGAPIAEARGKTYTISQFDTSAYLSVLVTFSSLLGSLSSDSVCPVNTLVDDTSYCGDGVLNVNCPSYPGYYGPGGGGDTSYCGGGVPNINCPAYPSY
jgi:uncharacterized protein YunC (DUF1805 family)